MTQPNNWARNLVRADLGLHNEPIEVVGKVSLREGTMMVQIELIQGLICKGRYQKIYKQENSSMDSRVQLLNL